MQICDLNECTGCGVCKSMCMHGAISFELDSLGKNIPVIDESKCRECYLCQKVCPNNKKLKFNNIKKCYAVWAKDKKQYRTSASGGVGSSFLLYALNSSYCVYTTIYEDDKLFSVKKIDFSDIDVCKGSKYVQSNMQDCYIDMSKDIAEGKKILFLGTPCQSAAVVSKFEKNRNQIITVDLICHGTPPTHYLEEYIKYILPDIEKKQITDICFRGEVKDYIPIRKILYNRSHYYDYYYTAFNDSLIFRDNCYSCKYAQKKRVSDITIGDFWGLQRKEVKKEMPLYVSCVLINTDKGEMFWQNANSDLQFVERTAEEAINNNVNLRKPSSIPAQRKVFEENYKKHGFVQAIKISGIEKKIVKQKMRDIILFLYHVVKRKFKKIEKENFQLYVYGKPEEK